MEGKLWRIALVLLLIGIPLAHPQFTDIEKEAREDADALGPLGALVSDWRVLSVMMAMIMVILVSLAYMFGQSFNAPELTAWAGTELVQTMVTVLIVLSFSGTIVLMDAFLADSVKNSNLGFECGDGTTNCAAKLASEYFNGMIDMGLGQVRGNLNVAAKAARDSMATQGTYSTVLLTPIPMLQATVSGTLMAGELMHMDRISVVLEHLGNLLSSMYALRYFVVMMSTQLGPIILILGIVARAFFVTRKLGGLLIAIGIGVTYFFPMMFVFNWLTLNVTLFGDSVISPDAQACPGICLIQPPSIVMDFGAQKVLGKQAILEHFLLTLGIGPDDPITDGFNSKPLKDHIEELESGGMYQFKTIVGRSLSSCNGGGTIGPGGSGSYCPVSCRELPYPLTEECLSPAVMEACAELPDGCRIIRYVDLASVDASVLADYDAKCPAQCRISPPLKSECEDGGCMDGLDYCRYRYRSSSGLVAPEGCQGDLSLNCIGNEADPHQSCVWTLPDKALVESGFCDECVFVPSEFRHEPAIYVACGEACGSSGGGPPKISPAEFARRSSEGMIGREEIKAVSALMLPGIVLPLLNMLLTVMFIQGLSQILGGDIDIPGLMRVL